MTAEPVRDPVRDAIVAMAARQEMLDALFAGLPGLIELRALGAGGRVARDFFEVGDADGIERFVEAHVGLNLYVAPATRRDRSSGELANCRALRALYIDGDFKRGGEDAVRQQLQDFRVPPGIRVASGAGVHPFWLLIEPLDLTNAEEVRRADAGLKRLAAHLGGDPPVAHPAAILRLPGTLNFKYDPPRPVVLERCAPQERWHLDEILDHLPTEAPPTTAPRRPARYQAPDVIREGSRYEHLFKTARSLKAQGQSEATALATARAMNLERCQPPHVDAEVERAVANAYAAPDRDRRAGETGDASPPPPSTTPSGPLRHAKATLWEAAVPAPDYLAAPEEESDCLDPEGRFFARGVITEWFSPRGLGKTNVILESIVARARAGLRVLLIDRDNPRREIRRRLTAMGAATTPTLKIIDRTQAPPLTDRSAWAAFPITDYAIVIIDSLDASAEGVGEQDSSKPSLAIASILDVARATDGPAVAVLGNTIKSGEYSRGSGVIEDRADIAYEIRDVTGFVPSGRKPWVEEMPSASRADWAGRAGRRTKRDRYRLAFIATKFRVGSEPEPFVLEVRHDTDPWSVVDVTSDMLAAGQAAQEAAQKAREEIEEHGLAAFVAALVDGPMTQRDAEAFLVAQRLVRTRARALLKEHSGTRWTRLRTTRRGHDMTLYEPLGGGQKPGTTAQVNTFQPPLQMRLGKTSTGAVGMDSGRHKSSPPDPAPDAGFRIRSLVPSGQIIDPPGREKTVAKPARRRRRLATAEQRAQAAAALRLEVETRGGLPYSTARDFLATQGLTDAEARSVLAADAGRFWTERDGHLSPLPDLEPEGDDDQPA